MNTTNSVRWLLNDCHFYQPTDCGSFELNICELVGNLAYHSMMLEVHLTPKPGLVDCLSSGAHDDMDITTFVASANSLRPYMSMFVKTGYDLHKYSVTHLFPELRKVGIEAEKAMFAATSGVNTHKGMIFTLGLICGVVGWLYKKEKACRLMRIQQVIKQCCADLVKDELLYSQKIPITAGEKLFQRYGITGIRGEAANGYPTVFNYALPEYNSAINRGLSEEQAMFVTLLNIMSRNDDSNLVNRGGLTGLNYVKNESKWLLSTCDVSRDDFELSMLEFDKKLVNKNLSPGGSADLLAATWLLAQVDLMI